MLTLVIALAGLDLAASIALKEARLRSDPALALAGVAGMVGVALLLYYALDMAELAVVSIGWIVLYQAGAIAADAALYRQYPTWWQLSAITVALLALAVAAFPAHTAARPPEVPPAETDSFGGGHVPAPRTNTADDDERSDVSEAR